MRSLENVIPVLDQQPDIRILERPRIESMRDDWRQLDKLKQSLSGCLEGL